MIDKKCIERVIYFFLRYNGNYIILDKPVYENNPYLVITTTESNYLGDIQTIFEDSVPLIKAYLPINKFTKGNKILNNRETIGTEVTLRFNGSVFKKIRK